MMGEFATPSTIVLADYRHPLVRFRFVLAAISASEGTSPTPALSGMVGSLGGNPFFE